LRLVRAKWRRVLQHEGSDEVRAAHGRSKPDRPAERVSDQDRAVELLEQSYCIVDHHVARVPDELVSSEPR
jgi:hypothetical protein